MTAPLMPKATAVWLVDNTTLTFRQIAKFCELHELEVQAIADGDIVANMVGANPIINGQLSMEEIKRCEADKSADLVANVMEKNVKERNAKAKRILSPSQRNDKPAAILWILKNCPEIADSQICKLIGTTKPTINKVRDGDYADIEDIYPKNPVAVGLCNEKELEEALLISQNGGKPRTRKPKKSPEEIAAEKELKTKERAKAKAAKARARAKAKAEKAKAKAAAKEAAKLAKAEEKALKLKEKAKAKAKAEKQAQKAKEKAKAKKIKLLEKNKAKIDAKKAKAKAKAEATKAKLAEKIKERVKAKVAKEKAKEKAKAEAKKNKAKEKAEKTKAKLAEKMKARVEAKKAKEKAKAEAKKAKAKKK